MSLIKSILSILVVIWGISCTQNRDTSTYENHQELEKPTSTIMIDSTDRAKFTPVLNRTLNHSIRAGTTDSIRVIVMLKDNLTDDTHESILELGLQIRSVSGKFMTIIGKPEDILRLSTLADVQQIDISGTRTTL